MTRPTENRSAFLAAVLARALPNASPAAIAKSVSAMQAAARAAHKWSETVCSYPLTDAQQARGDKRVAKLIKAADAALYACMPDFGTDHFVPTVAGLRFGGDPRGPCGWLVVSDMPGDGWGDGYAIYA